MVCGSGRADAHASQPEADTAPIADSAFEPAPRRDWSLRLTPYLWIPAQSGSVTVAGTRGRVDLDTGDTFDAITDSLNFGLTLHAELRRDDFVLFADVMYLSLETRDAPIGGDTGTVRQDTGVFHIGAAYRVVDIARGEREGGGGVGLSIEPTVALRAHYLLLDIETASSGDADGDRFWVDAVVGVRAAVDVSERVTFHLRGDVGAGDSDLTWSALAGVEFMLNDRLALQLGYRALDTDYDDGHGAERFAYDLLLYGPYAALTIDF
ncbi:MAG: hypothetical protein AAF995_00255 [Planctomycetota bacterium]